MAYLSAAVVVYQSTVVCENRYNICHMKAKFLLHHIWCISDGEMHVSRCFEYGQIVDT